MFERRQLMPLSDRGPLRVSFVITSMPVGGAETLLVNLIRRLDRERFVPELCCTKELGPLGEEMAEEVVAYSNMLKHKFDVGVLPRLTDLLRSRQVDAVVTVGAGDKMFWGRLAAWRAGVPVVLSALHSTGWPDGIGRLNRTLTPITDGFIGVASAHGRHLVENERFPEEKVHVIPNGVDVERFRRNETTRKRLRDSLGIDQDAPVVGIVAALRSEKNHLLFLRTAALVRKQLPNAQFVIIGDGPEREGLEIATRSASLGNAVHFLGTRSDIPELMSALDVFALTSHNEANPVSILEAMACQLPVVSTRVGSVDESVREGETGFLVEPGDAETMSDCWCELLSDESLRNRMGQAGRDVVVGSWSLDRMVRGYEELITRIYKAKCDVNPSQIAGDVVESALIEQSAVSSPTE